MTVGVWKGVFFAFSCLAVGHELIHGVVWEVLSQITYHGCCEQKRISKVRGYFMKREVKKDIFSILCDYDGYELICPFNGFDNNIKVIISLDKMVGLKEIEAKIK